MTLRQVFNATSRAVRGATRALRRDPTLAALVLVAAVLVVMTLLKWMRRRRRWGWEGAASGPEDCAKKDKYWDESRGKCMNASNCTSKGGNVVDGTCVGASSQKGCNGRNKYWDEDQQKCMNRKNCTKKGGKVVDGVCVVGAETHSAAASPAAEPKVTVWTDANFTGESYSYGIGDYDWISTFEDKISSVQVPPGLKVVLYEHDKLRGQYLTLTKDAPDLSHFPFGTNTSSRGSDQCEENEYGPGTTGCWNDIIGSLRVTRA